MRRLHRFIKPSMEHHLLCACVLGRWDVLVPWLNSVGVPGDAGTGNVSFLAIPWPRTSMKFPMEVTLPRTPVRVTCGEALSSEFELNLRCSDNYPQPASGRDEQCRSALMANIKFYENIW